MIFSFTFCHFVFFCFSTDKMDPEIINLPEGATIAMNFNAPNYHELSWDFSRTDAPEWCWSLPNALLRECLGTSFADIPSLQLRRSTGSSSDKCSYSSLLLKTLRCFYQVDFVQELAQHNSLQLHSSIYLDTTR